jgi:hypothetical protein
LLLLYWYLLFHLPENQIELDTRETSAKLTMTHHTTERLQQLANKHESLDVEFFAMAKLTPVQLVAEELHATNCNAHHHHSGDGLPLSCSWYEESWQHPKYTRKKYIKKATGLLQLLDDRKLSLTTFFEIMRSTQ